MQNNILTELAKPFHPSNVTWRPQAITDDKTKALAGVYVDAKAYMIRLDEVAALDWSVSYTPWGDRIICHLTINGITRSSTGEADSNAEWEENAGITAEYVAFTRACAMFGLGRYLYSLPVMWVEYDAEDQRFTEKSKARLHGIITQHYQRFLNGQPEPQEADPAATEIAEAQPATPGNVPEEAPVPFHPESEMAQALTFLDRLGGELYGEQRPSVKAHNVTRLVGDGGVSALALANVQTLINGLKRLKKMRQAL